MLILQNKQKKEQNINIEKRKNIIIELLLISIIWCRQLSQSGVIYDFVEFHCI